jgi:hypothetical protein
LLGLFVLAWPCLANEPAHDLVRRLAHEIASQAKPTGVNLLPLREPKTLVPGLEPLTFARLLREELTERGVKLDVRGTPARIDYTKLTPDATGTTFSQLDVTLSVGTPAAEKTWPIRGELLTRLLQVEQPVTDLLIPELARKLAAQLARHRIAVAHVQPLQGATSVGTGYARQLALALETKGVRRDETADYKIQGKIWVEPIESKNLTCTIFETSILSEQGREIGKCRAEAILPNGPATTVASRPGLADCWMIVPPKVEPRKPEPARAVEQHPSISWAADG